MGLCITLSFDELELRIPSYKYDVIFYSNSDNLLKATPIATANSGPA